MVVSKLTHSNQETMDQLDHQRAIADGNEDLLAFSPPPPWEAIPPVAGRSPGYAVRTRIGGAGAPLQSICAVLIVGDGTVHEIHSVGPDGTQTQAIDMFSPREEVLELALAGLRDLGWTIAEPAEIAE